MAFLSPVELVRLGVVRPELLSKLTQLMDRFENETGRKTYVSDDGGVRTPAKQSAIFADSTREGFRAATPGHSFHEYGAAFDLHIIGIPDDAAANQRDPLYLRLATIGESLGLRAGVRWDGEPDPYHFELNESLEQARQNWQTFKKKVQLSWSPSPS